MGGCGSNLLREGASWCSSASARLGPCPLSWASCLAVGLLVILERRIGSDDHASGAHIPFSDYRTLFTALLNGAWIDAADTAILTGPTGVGKSWLGCALGYQACRDNRSTLYTRVPKLFVDLALAHVDGRYPRLMRALGGVKLLILDDWGLEPLNPPQRHDLMEILEERYGRGATLITSQVPVDRWHDVIGDPTYADAILDRLVHNAHRVSLTGDSLRLAKRSRAPA